MRCLGWHRAGGFYDASRHAHYAESEMSSAQGLQVSQVLEPPARFLVGFQIIESKQTQLDAVNHDGQAPGTRVGELQPGDCGKQLPVVDDRIPADQQVPNSMGI